MTRRVARWVGIAVAALGWAAVTAWCALAAWYAPFGPSVASGALAAAVVAACAVAVLRPRRWPLRLACLLAAWGTVILAFWWWPAPGDRDWLPDCRVAPEAVRRSGQVTVRSVRDFRWRSDTDFDARWEERTYDLASIRSCDFFMSYWGPTLICHMFVSFGFERPDGTMDHVAVSIEARRSAGQQYAAVASAFRQFGLLYVWADEEDVVRVRTDVRGEEVHRYRLEMPRRTLVELFERYVAATDRLHVDPEWYNAVTQNCGVAIMRTAWGAEVPLFVSPRVLLNGATDREAYDRGAMGREEPFEVLRARSDVTAAARASAPGAISRAIRQQDVVVHLLHPERIRPLGQEH